MSISGYRERCAKARERAPIAWQGGPALGLSIVKGSYIQVGYNVMGFRDADYADTRYTRSGPFVTLRFKFDQTTLAGMGLTRH